MESKFVNSVIKSSSATPTAFLQFILQRMTKIGSAFFVGAVVVVHLPGTESFFMTWMANEMEEIRIKANENNINCTAGVAVAALCHPLLSVAKCRLFLLGVTKKEHRQCVDKFIGFQAIFIVFGTGKWSVIPLICWKNQSFRKKSYSPSNEMAASDLW